jgi:hypothetical protein
MVEIMASSYRVICRSDPEHDRESAGSATRRSSVPRVVTFARDTRER